MPKMKSYSHLISNAKEIPESDGVEGLCDKVTQDWITHLRKVTQFYRNYLVMKDIMINKLYISVCQISETLQSGDENKYLKNPVRISK